MRQVHALASVWLSLIMRPFGWRLSWRGGDRTEGLADSPTNDSLSMRIRPLFLWITLWVTVSICSKTRISKGILSI